MARLRILVVDDDPALRRSLERVLRLADYDVELAVDGRHGLDALAERDFALVVLDVAMPGVDGLDVLRQMRARRDRTPVLMLTARAALPERVDGLEAGADDYLVKPFAVEELLARVRALLRRSTFAERDHPLRLADLELDRATREAHRGERKLELSATEFSLLEMFLVNARHVLTRSALYDAVWGYDFGSSSKSLDVYVGYLRRKLEAAGEPRLLHTVRSVGYVLREP